MNKIYTITISVEEAPETANSIFDEIKAEAKIQANEFAKTIATNLASNDYYLKVIKEERAKFVELLSKLNIEVSEIGTSKHHRNSSPNSFYFYITPYTNKDNKLNISLEPIDTMISRKDTVLPFVTRYVTYAGDYKMNYTFESWCERNKQLLVDRYNSLY
jgi:hypothetical protein